VLKDQAEPARKERSRGLERATARVSEPQTLEDRSSMKGCAKHYPPSGVVVTAIVDNAIWRETDVSRGLSVRIGW
jgi:hypothetical protein